MIGTPVDAPVAEPINITDLIQNAMIMISGLFAIYFGMRKWVRQQVSDPVQKVYQQIQTGNGHTLGETTHILKSELDQLSVRSDRNFHLIEQLSKRLDEHQMFGSHHKHE